MNSAETLGVPAHPGGLLAERPELTVGVVRAVSRPDGLEIELLARQPLDRRTALQRQADIRAGRATTTGPAARRLLPEHDEGEHLRFGWLDGDGRAHWLYPVMSSGSSGDAADGMNGPSQQTVFMAPPLFDEAAFVLAWPEIGFPETVVRLPLPDRAAVERGNVSIWQAPTDVTAVPDSLSHGAAPFDAAEVAVEAGRAVAAPRVLHRNGDAAVVLTRLTAVGPVLSLEVRSIARGEMARGLRSNAFPRPPIQEDDTAQRLRSRPGASVAVLRGADALWLRPRAAMAAGGDQAFDGTSEFILTRPDTEILDLIIGWPDAGLPEAHVSIPLE